MAILVARAYLKLLYFDFYLAQGKFSALHENVRRHPRAEQSFSPDGIQKICAAVDLACIWYWKEVLCLQRSAATACLLKSHGVPAEMVIGARQLPFRAHAWVEVNGLVVNDKSYMREMYAVLDQC